MCPLSLNCKFDERTRCYLKKKSWCLDNLCENRQFYLLHRLPHLFFPLFTSRSFPSHPSLILSTITISLIRHFLKIFPLSWLFAWNFLPSWLLVVSFFSSTNCFPRPSFCCANEGDNFTSYLPHGAVLLQNFYCAWFNKTAVLNTVLTSMETYSSFAKYYKTSCWSDR